MTKKLHLLLLAITVSIILSTASIMANPNAETAAQTKVDSNSLGSEKVPKAFVARDFSNSGQAQLTKYHANGKMFYYVQFLQDSSDKAWFTIMLGHVTDGTRRFVVPDELFINHYGLLFDEKVKTAELNRNLQQFYEAVALAKTRFESNVRQTLLDIEQWMDSPTISIPAVQENDLVSIQKLHSLKMKIFRNSNQQWQSSLSCD